MLSQLKIEKNYPNYLPVYYANDKKQALSVTFK